MYSPDLSKRSYVKSIIFTLETFPCKNWILSQESPSKISTFNRFRLIAYRKFCEADKLRKLCLKSRKKLDWSWKKKITYSLTVVRAISCYSSVSSLWLYFPIASCWGKWFPPLPRSSTSPTPVSNFSHTKKKKKMIIHYASERVLTCYADVNFMNHPSTIFVQFKHNVFEGSSRSGTIVHFNLCGCSCISNQSKYVTITFLVCFTFHVSLHLFFFFFIFAFGLVSENVIELL